MSLKKSPDNHSGRIGPIPEEFRKIAVLSMGIEVTGLNSADKHRELVLTELQSCISICGGETIRFEPKGVTALFGTGKNSEQACPRAIDSSFRMMRTLELVNRSIEGENGRGRFAGRIGIVWGDASVNTDSLGRSVAEGRCITQAMEMMKSVAPGIILVSDDVRAACGDFCSWEKHGDGWTAKARIDHVTVHPLLMGIPLLGREREMEHLNSALNSFRKWHGHPPLMIIGKPGVGKTRLLENFLEQVNDPGTKIVRLTNKLWDQPPLGMWNPLMEKGTFDPYGTVMANVRQICAESELIICIEDLHWADDASLKLLDQLSRALCDSGAFLLLSSRSKPDTSLENHAERLTVEGLQPKAVKSLVECILGRPAGSEADRFTNFLMKRTAGNPLLAIELVLHSMETGAVGRESSGRWFIYREPEDVIPYSAESFLQARMSSLNPVERFALQVASALGNGFTEDNFTEIFSALGYDNGRIILSRMINLGFLSTARDSTYIFANSILSGTVYRTIISENRLLIHRTAAQVLSAQAERDQSGEGVIALARHWIESNSGAEAVPWLLKALEQCLDLGDVIRAETFSRELHSRTDRDSKAGEAGRLAFQDARLHLIMGKFQLALDAVSAITSTLEGDDLANALFLKAQATENLGLPLKNAIELYVKAADIADEFGNMNIKAQALSAAGSLYLAVGKRDRGLEAFNRALEHKDSLDTPSLAKLHGNMGILMHRTGSHDEALKHYRKTLELGKKCGNLSIEANALAFMGQVEINMGRRESGLERYREALAIHRRAGNKRGECTTLGNLGGQLARFGETESAIEMLERAVVIAEEIGHTRGIMSFHSNLGLAYKMAGNLTKAEKHIRTSMEMISRSGDKRAMAVAHLNLCTVLSKMARLSEAIDEARRALRFACTVNALTTQARALGNLGWLMIKTDRLEMAVNFFRESYRRSFLAEDHSMLADSKAGEGRAFYELGMITEAGELCSEAEDLKEKYGMDYEAQEGMEELKRLLEETGGYGQSS